MSRSVRIPALCLCAITSVNFDFIQRRRPLHNGLKSTVASGRSRSGPDSKGHADIGRRESLFL